MTNPCKDTISLAEIDFNKVIVLKTVCLTKVQTREFEDFLREKNSTNFPYRNSVYIRRQSWCLYLCNQSLYDYADLAVFYNSIKEKIPHITLTAQILEIIAFKTSIGFTFAEAMQQVVNEYLTNEKRSK